eukprot:scaffold5.g737.t1
MELALAKPLWADASTPHAACLQLSNDGGSCSPEVEQTSHFERAQPQEAAHDLAAAAATRAAAAAARAFAASFATAFSASPDLRGAVATALSAPALAAALAESEGELEEVLSLPRAHAIVKQASGVQGWLVAPEAGLRRLVAEGLAPALPCMLRALGSTHGAMRRWAEEAAQRLPLGGDEPRQQALRECLAAAAEAALAGWRDETEAALRELVAAEACVTPAAFASLRAQLAALSLAPGPVPGPAPAPAARAGKQGDASASAGAAVQAGVGTDLRPYFMGWLEKKGRRVFVGRWEAGAAGSSMGCAEGSGLWARRWCVLSLTEAAFSYYHKPDALKKPAAVLPLRGAAILAAAAAAPGEAFPLTFLIQAAPGAGAAGAPGAAAKRVLPAIALRADSPGVAQQWLELLSAVASGAASGPAAGEPRGKPAPASAAAARRDSSEEHAEEGSQGQDQEESVPRKISTAVYAAPAPLSSAPAITGTDTPRTTEEREAAAAAAEAALVDELAAAAAARGPGPLEAAQLALALPAVGEYVAAGRARLAELCPKLIRGGMLGRADEMYGVLLAAALALAP